MKTLTSEQREALKPFERQLYTALHGNYATGLLSTPKKTLFALYKELAGSNPGNIYCNECVMLVLKTLAKAYFADAPEKGQNDPLPSTNAPKTEQPSTEKKKAPQKAKNTPKKKTTKKHHAEGQHNP